MGVATAKRHNAWGGRGRRGEDDGGRDDGAYDGGLGTIGGGGQRSVGGRTIAEIRLAALSHCKDRGCASSILTDG